MLAFDFPSRRAQRARAVRGSRVWESVLAIACSLFLGASAFAQTPTVGAKAPDFTLSTPTGKTVRLSAEQGRSGVPTYVVFKGNSAAQPHVLPELLTRSVVLDALHQAGS